MLQTLEKPLLEKEKPLYPNLRAEMARLGVTITMLAELLGVRINTISDKMTGKIESGFTLKEAVQIKKFLGVDIPLEVLFAER